MNEQQQEFRNQARQSLANIATGNSVARVAMPLVRLMQYELSWADREAVADALLRVLSHNKAMDEERHMMMAKDAAQQHEKQLAEAGVIGRGLR